MTKKIFLALSLSFLLSACTKKIEDLITPPSPTPEKSGVTIIPIDTSLAQATLVDLTTKTKIDFSSPVATNSAYSIQATTATDSQDIITAYFDEFEFTNNGSGKYSQDDLVCTVTQTSQADTYAITVTCSE